MNSYNTMLQQMDKALLSMQTSDIQHFETRLEKIEKYDSLTRKFFKNTACLVIGFMCFKVDNMIHTIYILQGIFGEVKTVGIYSR